MIILEGPDGAGKTILAEKLSQDLNIPIAPKFVKSNGDGAGTDDLFGEAYKDVVTMPDKPPMIYDRHPLISEYIYGPIVRNMVPPDFVTTTAHAALRLMAQQVHVIWCLPPLAACMDNIRDPAIEQMQGVDKHLESICMMYHTMRIWWPGESSVYDYTVPRAFSSSRYSYENAKAATRLHTSLHIQRSKR